MNEKAASDRVPVVDGHDRLWVNADRTVFVRLWRTGTVEVARREHPSHTWGPPVLLAEEPNG